MCNFLHGSSVSCPFLHPLYINDSGTSGVGKIKDRRSSFYNQTGPLRYSSISKTERAENKTAGTDKHRALYTFLPNGD